MFNNSKIVTQMYDIRTDKIRGELRIAHLSDLHEKEFGENNELLFSAVKAIEPHIIAISGDIVARETQSEINKMYVTTLARELTHIAPTFFSTGNHEKNLYEDMKYIFEEHGATVTDGTVTSFDFGGSKLNVSGMHDLSFGVDIKKRTNVFSNIKEGFNVFLSHRPECYEEFLNKNIDLVLSGHTHAGQVRFPGFGSFAMYGQGMFPKYVQGKFSDGKTSMIISRGLGASGYPTIRINNPPELVFVKINNL